MLGKGHGLSTTVILGPHGSEQHRDALAPERTLHYEAAAKAEGAGLKVVQKPRRPDGSPNLLRSGLTPRRLKAPESLRGPRRS